MDKTLISILAGLGGMFGWGTSDFLANYASEKIGHFKTFFWSQFAGMVLTGAIMFYLQPTLRLSFSTVGILVLGSILYTTGYLYFYKAFEIGNVSVISAAINLNTVIAIILAYIFLGQRLTKTQLPAVVMIIIGITLVSINLNDFKKGTLSLLLGVRETIIASLAFGVFWNLSQILSPQIGWAPTTFFVKLIALLFLVILSFFTKSSFKYDKKHLSILPTVILVGILEAIAVASVNFGLTVGDLVLINPISSALSVVTILLAVIFLREKISKIQLTGMVIALAGIILTSF